MFEYSWVLAALRTRALQASVHLGSLTRKTGALRAPTAALVPANLKIKGEFLGDFSPFALLYSTLLHLPPLRLHCVGGCSDRIHDRCDFGILEVDEIKKYCIMCTRDGLSHHLVKHPKQACILPLDSEAETHCALETR
jgi:hypothetical protein